MATFWERLLRRGKADIGSAPETDPVGAADESLSATPPSAATPAISLDALRSPSDAHDGDAILDGSSEQSDPSAPPDELTHPLKDLGVPDLDAQRWIDYRFAADEAAAWRAAGCHHAFLAAQWRKAGIGINDAALWIRGKLSDPRGTTVWSKAGWDANMASPWLVEGFRSPKVAARWADAGVTATDAGKWRSLGFDDPQLASRLIAEGVSPDSLAELESRGVSVQVGSEWLIAQPSLDVDLWMRWLEWAQVGVSPDSAELWTLLGVEPADAQLIEHAGLVPEKFDEWWINHGFTIDTLTTLLHNGMMWADIELWLTSGIAPEAIFSWYQVGFSPKETRSWQTIGVLDANTCKHWVEVGFTPDDARDWLANGTDDASHAKAWMVEGFLPIRARQWAAARFAPATARSWVEAGFDAPSAVTPWLSNGITPTDAERLQKLGVYSSGAASWIQAGFSVSQAVDWINAEVRNPNEAARCEALGLRMSTFSAWRAMSFTLDEACRWLASGFTLPSEARSWHREGFAPSDAASWKRQGLDPAKARERLRGTPEPKRIASPPLFSPPLNSSAPAPALLGARPQTLGVSLDQWLTEGTQWIESAGMRPTKRDAFLRMLHERGLRWAPMDKQLFSTWPKDDWIEEILARAEVLHRLLRRVPEWPITFAGDDLTIILYGGTAWVRAWVGHNGTGLLVSFRQSDFDVKFMDNDYDARFALGAAISWYLDVSVSLVATTTHPHFERHPSAKPRSPSDSNITYVPRPSFKRDVDSLTAGDRPSPRAHRVVGHIRTLSDTRTPTEEARSNAPAWMRLRMGPNDTFVRPHTRGGEGNLRELTLHLSKYSALADCLGLVDSAGATG